MVQIRAKKGLRAAKDKGIEKGEDCKASSGDSGPSKKNKGESNAGGGPSLDGLPWTNGRLWALKHDRIVAELLAARDNQWTGMVHQDSNKWTTGAWRKVNSFPIHGKRMSGQTKKFVDGKIKNPPSPKDGYVVVDCKDVKTRRLLEFLVLILYPEKPTKDYVAIGKHHIWYYDWREGGRLDFSYPGYCEKVIYSCRKI